MLDLALTVIVRDEARCLARCLTSAIPFVNRLVVVDTGSTDSTVEIAQRCGAEVHHFPWNDDFSAARNRALALAGADWHLVLDADEWIEDCENPDVLRSAAESSRSIGLVCIRSQFDLQGRVEQADSWIPRLLPSGVLYHGRIHEQPEHTLAEVRLPLLVLHDGYRRERLASKIPRNLRILREELDCNPGDAYLHYQMGVQYEVQEDWALACHHYSIAFREASQGRPFSHELSYRYLNALCRAGQQHDAQELGLVLQTRWPESSDILFVLGTVYLELAEIDPSRALSQWLPCAEASWKRCLEIGEFRETTGHVHGRGSFLAALNLSVVYERLGDRKLSQQYYRLSQAR